MNRIEQYQKAWDKFEELVKRGWVSHRELQVLPLSNYPMRSSIWNGEDKRIEKLRKWIASDNSRM